MKNRIKKFYLSAPSQPRPGATNEEVTQQRVAAALRKVMRPLMDSEEQRVGPAGPSFVAMGVAQALADAFASIAISHEQEDHAKSIMCEIMTLAADIDNRITHRVLVEKFNIEPGVASEIIEKARKTNRPLEAITLDEISDAVDQQRDSGENLGNLLRDILSVTDDDLAHDLSDEDEIDDDDGTYIGCWPDDDDDDDDD